MGTTWKDLALALQKGASFSWGAFEMMTEDKRRFRSVLNGIIGDTLHAQGSRLAIDMRLLGEIRGENLCVLVHGLCDSEDTWKFPEEPDWDYGRLMQRDFGYSPLFVSYNTGLHISTNGQLLAQKLNEIHEENSGNIENLIFIGHSMGGLVVRSACHYGQKENAAWVKRVKKIFLLGVPHLGSDWEKLGQLTSIILKTIPNPFTWGIAALGNRRSAGIKDLRWGYLLDEDWQDEGFSLKDNRHPVPLLEGTEYYLIGAALAKKSDNFFTQYFGDGLVPARSAAGRSFRKSKSIPFSPDSFKVVKGLSHTDLTHHQHVYEQIRKWSLQESAS